MTIAISSNTAWSLFNFRRGLIGALRQHGERVVVIAPPDAFSARLSAMGCEVIDLPIDNKGSNPMRDGASMLAFRRLYRQIGPDIALHYTIKPVIYGSLAAHSLGIPVINVITGLGTAFVNENWLTRIVETLYRISQRKVKHVFFLNEEDMALFESRRLMPNGVAERLPGEGIDLSHFAPADFPQDPARFLLAGRLLWDKGVGEFVAASRRIRQQYPDVKFQLLGPSGVASRSAIAQGQIDQWCAEGVVEYLGETDDVRPFIARAQCIVLPSFYREGLPRVLMEAGAMCRPIITTNAPGCRDVVDDGVNGYLCRPQDADDLADRMLRFLALTHEARRTMGEKSREKMRGEFDEQLIIAKYRQAIDRFRRKPH